MYNVYIIMFSIICICECVYIDRFLDSFLLNNNPYRIQMLFCLLFCLLWWQSGFFTTQNFVSVLNN